ncbi:hypothetical protein JL721_8588 [Aureococcus anophagefferens]|nr:hypothetical protein JL721_8588 [Aureococcus anophagefferens]
MKKFQMLKAPSASSRGKSPPPAKRLGACGLAVAARAPEVENFKRDNEDAERGGDVEVVRRSFMPGILSTTAVTVRQSFKSIGGKRSKRADELLKQKSLGRKRIKGVGLQSKFLSGRDFAAGQVVAPMLDLSFTTDDSAKEEEEAEEPARRGVPFDVIQRRFNAYREHEPLVLYEPTDDEVEAGAEVIEVPPILCQWLRPHQREGVQFVFECVYGMKDYGGEGAILADDMGLGKTLQSITLLYTLLKSLGRDGKRIAKRVIVVCPCSLVKNWQDEFEKWVNCRAKTKAERIECMALADTTRKTVEGMIDQFLSPANYYDVLVVSYETFRMQVERFARKKDSADLIICDEAHRLKNQDAQTSQALASLACRRRVLLSGTPMQNDLVEFFSMANFTNPGIFGTREEFTKHYEGPILRGREPDASDAAKRKGQDRQRQLSALSDMFIIRRMNRLNAQHLPPKLTQVVCCRLTPTQEKMYRHVIRKRDEQAAVEGHPEGGSAANAREAAELRSLMPEDDHMPRGRGGRVLSCFSRSVDAGLSGKMLVLHRLMAELHKRGKERIVVVSVFMTTLDLIEAMCNQEGWHSCKLGGNTSTKKRKQFNDDFNDPGLGLLRVNHFATDDLKKLFLFRPKTASDLHDELQCKACKGRAAARKDTSKAGGKNALSDGAADACLAFLENAVLAGDGHADACARLAAPVAVSADEASLHGAVERKRWNDAKPHMDLGSVKAKLAARGYGTIQQVLKDLRLVERCCRKLFDAGHATLNAAALMVRQVEDGWPGLVPQLYAANAAADETAAAADAVVCAPCDAPAEDGDGFKRQLYPLPKEEDLNNWSHHADLSTVQDEVLRRALRGQPQVSFVMGMYQDWDLIQQDTARQKEIEELEAKQKAEDLESARALAEAAAAEGDVCDGGDGGAPTTKKKKKKKQDDAGEPSEAKAKKKRAPAAAADATPGGDSVASAAPSEAASAAPSEAASTPTAAPDGPRFPTAGQVIHVAWDKASTVDAAPNRCVVEAVGEPLPDKKRKGPDHLCFHAVARVKFLDVLDADGGFARVGAEDPRPRYVAEAFKLALTKYGTTWRVPDGATPMADVTNA